MGLVQVISESDNTSGSLDVEGSEIVWDKTVEKIIALYGSLTIDYITTLFGDRFVVEFEGGMC